jgi:hypothetical protein
MRNKIILAICGVFMLMLLILSRESLRFGVSDILKATVLIIAGYPVILALQWLWEIGNFIPIFIFFYFYVIIRAIVGLFVKNKYTKIYRILAVIVWVIGGWVMYMLQFT